MFNRKYFGLIMGIWMILVLSLTMAIVVQVLTVGNVSFMPSVIMVAETFSINFIASLVIPANRLGDIFAKKIQAKENTFWFLAISNFIVCAIYVTIVSFAMTVINVGISPELIPSWLSIYPIVFTIGYFISLAVTPVAARVTEHLVA